MLKEDIQEVVDNCRTLTYWNDLDSVRQLVVADMVFNLGLTRFLKFTNLGVALLLGDFSKAGEEMIDSRWYVQVGRRAVRLVKAMRSGVWE
jgi:lysozyme